MLALALASLGVTASACSSVSTPSAPTTTPTRPGATTPPAQGTTGSETAETCAMVQRAKTTFAREGRLPAADVQDLLATAETSHDHSLEDEALALASASHTLDDRGVGTALAALADTCATVSPAAGGAPPS